jgi:hypothetical protein
MMKMNEKLIMPTDESYLWEKKEPMSIEETHKLWKDIQDFVRKNANEEATKQAAKPDKFVQIAVSGLNIVALDCEGDVWALYGGASAVIGDASKKWSKLTGKRDVD